MKRILLLLCLLASLACPATAQVNPCIEHWTTNCLVGASVSLALSNPPPLSPDGYYLVCQGSTLSLATTLFTNFGAVLHSDSNGCQSDYASEADPILLRQYWSLNQGADTTTGESTDPIQAPTNAGPCSLTFYVDYTNAPPCTDSGTATLSVALDVLDGPRTNDLSCSGPAITNSPADFVQLDDSDTVVCVGQPLKEPTVNLGNIQLSPGRLLQMVYECPGPTNRYLTNDITYTIQTNYWDQAIPTNGLDYAGTFSSTLYVVCQTTNTNSLCLSSQTLAAATVTYEAVSGSGSRTLCASGPAVLNPGTLSFTNIEVCIGETVSPPVVSGLQTEDGVARTITRNCEQGTTETSDEPAGYWFSDAYAPNFPWAFGVAGTYVYPVQVDAYPSGTGPCYTTYSFPLGTFTVVVKADKTTNSVCLPGTLVSPGVLSADTAVTCVGAAPPSPPSFSSPPVFSQGTNSVQVTVCGDPNNPANTSTNIPVTYTLSTFWLPALGSPTNAGAYVLTNYIVAVPDCPACARQTNAGPAFTLIVNPAPQTNRSCVPGPITTAGSLAATATAICVGNTPDLPEVRLPVWAPGTNTTVYSTCDGSWHTNLSTFSYTVTNHWTPELSRLDTVGGQSYACLAVATPEGAFSACATPITNQVGTFTVTVNPAAYTNSTCSPGALTNAGTLTFSSAITFPGYSVAFPTLTNAGYGQGQLQTNWTTCDNPVPQSSTTPVPYATSWYWQPPPPTNSYTNEGSFSYATKVVGTPSGTTLCSAVTNDGPAFDVSVIKVELDPGDSNSVTSTAGTLLMVNNGDADRDGVPNFADFQATGATNGFGNEKPLTLKIPSAPGREKFKVKFTYPDSNPAAVQVDNSTTPPTYTPAAGMMRLWLPHGADARSPQAAPDGRYLAPEHPYSLQELGFTDSTVTGAVLYVEAVKVSSSAEDIKLTVQIDPDGDGEMGYLEVATNTFTALDLKLAEATSGTAVEDSNTLKDSQPIPVVTNAVASVLRVQPSLDGSQLLADVDISATIKSAICDITAGSLGSITNVYVYLDGYAPEDAPDGVPLAVTKTTNNIASFTAPYPYNGALNWGYRGVPVDVGTNVIRITATDPATGLSGYAELSFEVTATELNPPVAHGLDTLYSNTRVGLDFGASVHSLTNLATNTPVQFSFDLLNYYGGTNVCYTGAVYRVSGVTNGPLVLKNDYAWVVITDTNQLENFLAAETCGQALEAIVGVPALAEPNILFQFNETGTNTSRFTNDYVALCATFSGQPTSNQVDSLTTLICRLGQGWQTNVLTETQVDSLLFENSSGAIQFSWPDAPEWQSTNIDTAVVALTHTGLGLTNRALEVWETDTNTLVFETFDEYLLPDNAYGRFFGLSFAAGPSEVTAASESQDLHLYFAQFQGPADVLTALAAQSGGRVAQGPDGKYYMANTDQKPAAILGLDANPTGPVGTNCTGTALGGAIKGVAGGVKAFVWDGWYALGEKVWEKTLDPLMDAGFDIYEVTSGTRSTEEVLLAWQERFKRETPVAERLMTYTLGQLDKSDSDLDVFIEGLLDEGASAASDEFRRQTEEVQQGIAVAASALKAMYDDLDSGCPERKGEIIGRATFEIGTIAFSFAKAGQAARTSQAVKVGEVEMIGQLQTRVLVQQEATVSASVAKVAESLTSKGTLVRAAGGTGANYNKLTGQGLYVLVDSKNVVKYVGRGDARARIAAHKLDPAKQGFTGHILWENNLTKAEAKGLEQRLIERFGGTLKKNPRTRLVNIYNSFDPRGNPNRWTYRAAATDELIQSTLNKIPKLR